MVRHSDHVVVAVVEKRETRWNPQHTLIVTDYTLAVEERLKGEAPARVTVTVPGGTIGDRTHGTCLSVRLDPGSRYLLFLGSLERPTLSPITGAWQGMFREAPGKDGRSGILAGTAREPMTVDGISVEFKDFVEAVRDLVTRVEASPETREKRETEEPRQDLPAKIYDPSARSPRPETVEPLAAPLLVAPPPPPGEEIELVAFGSLQERFPEAGNGEFGAMWDSYSYENRPPAPIVFNPLRSGVPYASYDLQGMAYWNVYARNLFRAYANPTGTWAFDNGVFDIAGFPSNAAMVANFGEEWGDGTLGITYTLSIGGRIIEADVALNPAFQWTLDIRQSRQRTHPANLFQSTMVHELGHAWGLNHPWEVQDVWWDSVMNYANKEFDVGVLTADDTQAVRKAYPGTKIRDLLVSSFVTRDTPGDPNASYFPATPSPSVVSPGSTFVLTDFIKIENIGTVKVNKPSVEVYLTPEPYSFANSIYLGTVRYKFLTKPWSIHNVNVGTLRVPAGTPGGTYYIAYFIRDRADKYQGNNWAWSNATLTVR